MCIRALIRAGFNSDGLDGQACLSRWGPFLVHLVEETMHRGMKDETGTCHCNQPRLKSSCSVIRGTFVSVNEALRSSLV